MTYIAVFNDDYLAHHGVKGMKWGVRKKKQDYRGWRDAKNWHKPTKQSVKKAFNPKTYANYSKIGRANIKRSYADKKQQRDEIRRMLFSKGLSRKLQNQMMNGETSVRSKFNSSPEGKKLKTAYQSNPYDRSVRNAYASARGQYIGKEMIRKYGADNAARYANGKPGESTATTIQRYVTNEHRGLANGVL